MQSLGRRPLSVRCDASQKHVVITGGNTGIGYISAKVLAEKGYRVTIACRDPVRAAEAEKRIRAAVPGASVRSVPLDLADLASVRDCASRLLDAGEPIDVLLNNAGVMATPKMQTKDGFEFQLGINHLGHFLLTTQLLPSILESKRPTRIINVASEAHKFGRIDFSDLQRERNYQPWDAYGQSKLANVMFSYELARRIKDSPQVTVNALHPGVVRTELGRYMVNDQNKLFMAPAIALAYLFMKTPEQGAETSIHLASSKEVEGLSSKYWDNCKPVSSAPSSYDMEVARKLYDLSSELVAAKVPISA